LKTLIPLLVILIFAFVHSRGIRFGFKIQSGLTLFTVVMTAGLVLAGFSAVKGNWGHFSEAGKIPFNLNSWRDFSRALILIMFCYTGWNASTYIGSEVKDPRRNIPRSLLLGTGIVILLYLGINLFYIYSLPATMAQNMSISHLTFGGLLGDSSAWIMNIVMSLTQISLLCTFFIVGPRVYYAMARNQVFFKFASEVNPRSGVPFKSIALQTVIASLFVILGSFDEILTYSGLFLWTFPILAVFGVFKLRRENRSSVRLPGFPFVQIFYIWISVFILWCACVERPLGALFAILAIVAGMPLYFYFKHYSHIRIFSMMGRLNRAGYFWIGLSISASMYAIFLSFGLRNIAGGESILALVVVLIVYVGGIVAGAFQVVKRLHDLGRPGSHYWLIFIPIYNIYLAFVLLFEKGMKGDNEYGPDPIIGSRQISPKSRCYIKGRLGRAGYCWMGLAIAPANFAIPALALVLTENLSSGEILVAYFISLLASIGASIAFAFQVVKRLHDLGRPGLHYWLLYVPLYNIYLAFVLFFKKGTEGDNAYGVDPLARASC
jgi:uncharacterized membrane protein YhaH (DUF805 family)